jgi:uncharacterized protein YbaR (Trm112 family)
MKKEQLFCPYCKGELKVTHQERYQDLPEHVSDPNGTPSLKDGYECLNEDCLAHGTHTWIADGDYYTTRPKDIEFREWENLRKEKAGGNNFHAIGSWNYYYQKGKDAIKAKTFKLDLYFYKFVFSPKEKGWDYPEEIRHMPNMWKWKVEIWKKSSDYGYINVIPFWKMTKFCIRQFNQTYRAWKENGYRQSLVTAYCNAHSLEEWRLSHDNRFHSRLAGLIIRTFYPKRVKQIDQAFAETKIVNNF